MLDILQEYRTVLWEGLSVTLRLAIYVWLWGIGIGTCLGILSSKYPRFVGIPKAVVAFVLSGVPVLVFLFWAHYPVQAMLGVVVNPFVTAVVVLAVINTFAVASIIKSGLDDFPEQYISAAKVCGLSGWTTFTRIQLPIVLRQTIPALLPLEIGMLHATLFASLISVDEVFRIAQRVNSVEYKPIQIYSALAILFLGVSLPVNGLALWLRHHFTRNTSEQ